MKHNLIIATMGVLVLTGAGCTYESKPPAAQAPVATSTPPAKSFVSLDTLNKQMNHQECDNLPAVNNAESNTEFIFKNQDLGLEVIVPYNEAWGVGESKVAPAEVSEYEKGVKSIIFGRVTMFGEGGCSWVRDYRIDVVPKRDKAQLIKDLVANQTIPDADSLLYYKDENVGDKKVMHYKFDGLCLNDHYEVVGEKHNYAVSTFCADGEEYVPVLEKIVTSIKFI